MSYHNVRDKSGKFAPKAKKEAQETKKEENKPVEKITILNALLLDDTASMGSKRKATIDGFNAVMDQTDKDTVATGTDNPTMLAYFGEAGYFALKPITRLSEENYKPIRPSTALWYAVVRMIEEIDLKLATLPKNSKVIFTIFTDGENNQAQEYHRLAQGFIKLKQGEGWVINFVGAGDEVRVKAVSKSIGIYASNTMSFMDNSAGATKALSKLSDSSTRYRGAAASGQCVSSDGFFSNT